MHERFKRVIWTSRGELISTFSKTIIDLLVHRGRLDELNDLQLNISACIQQFMIDIDTILNFSYDAPGGCAKIDLQTLGNLLAPILKSNEPLLRVFEKHCVDYDALSQSIVCEYAKAADAQAWLDRHSKVDWLPYMLQK
jgi:hypothetical protein